MMSKTQICATEGRFWTKKESISRSHDCRPSYGLALHNPFCSAQYHRGHEDFVTILRIQWLDLPHGYSKYIAVERVVRQLNWRKICCRVGICGEIDRLQGKVAPARKGYQNMSLQDELMGYGRMKSYELVPAC
jgi:hypothetical protein